MRHLGQNIGRGRRDDKHLSPLGQRYMLHIPVLRALKGVHGHRIGAQRLKGERSDELRGVPGHNHADTGPQMPQTGDQIRAFVRGNASRYAQHDLSAG